MWPYPEIRTIADITRYNARRFPDKPALLFEGNTTTMAELDRLTSRFANGLIEAGIQPGDRVVFYGSNSDDFLIALLGTATSTVGRIICRSSANCPTDREKATVDGQSRMHIYNDVSHLCSAQLAVGASRTRGCAQ